MFYKTSLPSLRVKRYLLTTGHTDQQTLHEQCFARLLSLSASSIMQHRNSTFLCPFPFFCPYHLSTSPHRCLDANENSIWSCTFLTEYCYKNRKKLCLPQNPQTLLKKEFLNSFYMVLSRLLSWG